MKTLKIKYSTYKSLLQNNSLPTYYTGYYDEEYPSKTYFLYGASKQLIYTCKVDDVSDVSDFETNFKDSCTLVDEKDDAIALACIPMKYSCSGLDVAAKSLYVDGKTLEISSGDSSAYVEWSYDYTVELQGLDVQVDSPGAIFGDYLDLTVQHPTYGEVARFGNAISLLGTNFYQVLSPIVSEAAAGLAIRLTYHAIDTDGRKIISKLHCYK